MKKPWAFIRVPYMNPTIMGVIGPGFLNQVPTLWHPGANDCYNSRLQESA